MEPDPHSDGLQTGGPQPVGQQPAANDASSLHVLWHWVIITAIMTALIGGAALVL